MNLRRFVSAVVVGAVGLILARSAIRHCFTGTIETPPVPGNGQTVWMEVRRMDNPSVFWRVTILEFAGGLLCLGLALAIALLPI